MTDTKTLTKAVGIQPGKTPRRPDALPGCGRLVRVLEDWSPSFEGLFLYYPGRRQVPATLRAFIDMIREARGSAPTRRSLQNPFTKD